VRTGPGPSLQSKRCGGLPPLPHSGAPVRLLCVALGLALGCTSIVAAGQASPSPSSDIADFLGTWRGSSTCTDRVTSPACHDETVIYEVRATDKAGVARVAADKVVDRKRLPMGEFDFSYDQGEGCWRAEFQTSSVHGVWCFVVEGRTLTGTLRLLPGGTTVRKVQLRHD
jgi:hypothetical protein